VATATNAIAFGAGSVASYANSVAIGAGSVTGLAAPTGTGYLTGAAAPLSEVSVGNPTALRRITNVADGSAPQDAVTVSQLQVVATQASDAVMYDSSSHMSVTLGGVGASSTVALTNVAAGAITATSTDAINGSQLFTLETQIDTLGSQGAKISEVSQTTTTSGASSNSKYVAVNSTGSAASATGTESVAIGGNSTASSSNGVAVGSGSHATGAGSSAVGANAVASAPNSVALGAGSVASEADSVSVGSPGNERTITNLAPGVNSTDAVNMSQLNSVQDSVNSVARTAYSGIAAATALTMIPEVDQGKTLSVGVGTGSYQGYSAVALGFTARVAQNVKVKGGVSVTDAGTVYGAGVGYQW
jgi:autotransporter adhesin